MPDWPSILAVFFTSTVDTPLPYLRGRSRFDGLGCKSVWGMVWIGVFTCWCSGAYGFPDLGMMRSWVVFKIHVYSPKYGGRTIL
jgi:hypothetical protein